MKMADVEDEIGNEDCLSYCYSNIQLMFARSMKYAQSSLISLIIKLNTFNAHHSLWTELSHSTTSQP